MVGPDLAGQEVAEEEPAHRGRIGPELVGQEVAE